MGDAVPRMKLGSQGLEVSAQGLGCMGMSYFYGQPKPDSDMIRLIHHAVQSGVTLLDTSDFYGPHTNEILISKVCFSFIVPIFHHLEMINGLIEILKWPSDPISKKYW